MKKLLAFTLIAFFCLSLKSQAVKGLYVDGFSTILNNTQREDSLLQYAQANGYNYLALYELHLVQAAYDLTNFTSIAPLASFINRAKTQYGILQVGAVAENYWFFKNRIHVYNQAHTNPNEKFDVYNLEFEFWLTSATGPSGYYCTTYLQPNGFPCDTAGAFAFYKSELRKIDSLAATIGKISETYVGWPTQGQAHQITALCDRVLLHAYVTNDNAAYGYAQTRLSYFGTAASVSNIIVIFSAEPSFMGPWLASNPESTAWTSFSNDFIADNSSWTGGINLIGYQWFAWSFMPFDLSLQINEETRSNQLQVYQLQNQIQASIDVPEQEIVFTLKDVNGKLLSSINSENNGRNPSCMFNMGDRCSGMYLVEAENKSTGEVSISKIVFQNINSH